MQASGLLSGGAPIYKKYQASATGYLAGTLFLVTAAEASGQVSVSTTTSWVASIGLSQDGYALAVGAPMAYSTTQGADVALTTILINPDLILRALMVGSATNAVLVDNLVDVADATGLTVNATNTMSNLDEGTIWYTSGANAGKYRKITSVATATATVIIPFAANAVNDIALAVNTGPGKIGVTMGTNLLNLLQNNTALQGTGVCIDLELNGNSNSYALLIQDDHAFGSS